MEYDSQLHEKLVEVGKKIEKGIAHKLEPEMIDGIIATLQYFGLSEGQEQTLVFDLKVAKYKIFDWLGMWYSGRCETSDALTSKAIQNVIEKMIRHYIAMEHVGGWAWSFRGHIDLDVADDEMINSKCQDCIDSYEDWHGKTPEQRDNDLADLTSRFDDNVISI